MRSAGSPFVKRHSPDWSVTTSSALLKRPRKFGLDGLASPCVMFLIGGSAPAIAKLLQEELTWGNCCHNITGPMQGLRWLAINNSLGADTERNQRAAAPNVIIQCHYSVTIQTAGARRPGQPR